MVCVEVEVGGDTEIEVTKTSATRGFRHGYLARGGGLLTLGAKRLLEVFSAVIIRISSAHAANIIRLMSKSFCMRALTLLNSLNNQGDPTP